MTAQPIPGIPAAGRSDTEQGATDRLVIESIRAETFGGLSQLDLELGGGLVVVAGPNESGKSSLSELMSWLLVGPSGTADEAQRFGAAGALIGGRITGMFRGLEFRATGEFRVLQKGAPNEAGLSVVYGKQQLDAAGWRTSLGGIDAAMLEAVYAMWGAGLHDGKNLMAKIDEAALGGIAGSRNVGDLGGRLEDDIRTLLVSRAAGSESFRKMRSAAKDLSSEIRTIRVNASEYADLQHERDGIDADVAEIRGSVSDLDREISARDTLLAVAAQVEGVRENSQLLADADPPPESWSSLIDDPAAVQEAVLAIDDAEGDVDDASATLRAAVAAAGVTEHEAQAVRVGQPEVVAVTRVGSQLTTAHQQVEQADIDLRGLRVDRDGLQADFDRALARCPGQTTERLRGVTLEAGDLADVRSKIELWKDADSKVGAAETALAGAETKLADSHGAAQRATEAWDRFGTGSSAQGWIRAGGVSAAQSADSAGRRGGDWWVFAIAAGVAVGASFVLPRIAWSIVTVAAFASAFLFQHLVRNRVGAGSVAGTGADGDGGSSSAEAAGESMRVAADRVVSAEGIVGDAEGSVSSARGSLDHARQIRVRRARDAAERAALSGLVLRPGYAESEAHVNAVSAAVTALGRLDPASSALDAADSGAADLREIMGTLEGEMRRLLNECGIPDRVRPESASDVIGSFQAVSVARSDVDRTQDCHSVALQHYANLVAPVAAEIEGWSRSRVVDRCHELAEVTEERSDTEVRMGDFQRQIDHRMSDDALAQNLHGQQLSKDDLAAEKSKLAEQKSALESRRSDLDKRLGEIRNQLDQIAQKSELARLSAEVGALEDASDDRVIDAAARGIALTLLNEVAETQRQANQPELVNRASELLASVQSDWQQILVGRDGNDDPVVSVRASDGTEVTAHQLSTGARALLYLSLRLAMADKDATDRGFRFPIVCDDPLVHIDDQRAREVLPLLVRAVERGHQVILLTCHVRTVEAARAVGAQIIPLAGGLS